MKCVLIYDITLEEVETVCPKRERNMKRWQKNFDCYEKNKKVEKIGLT